MKKKSYWFYLITLVSILAVLCFFVYETQLASAADPGDLDDVDLHIKVEGSVDNQATWFNFSGTEESGNVTLITAPDTNIFYRIKVWNDGTRNANNVQVEGTISNYLYVAGLSADGDGDFDGHAFVGFTFTGGGAGIIDQVAIGGSEEADFQSIEGDILLAPNIPSGQTIMLGAVRIVDYEPDLIVQNRASRLAEILGIKKARALGVDRQSAIRISITVGGNAVPGTKIIPSPSSSPAASEAVEILPETGGPLLNFIDINFIKYALQELKNG